MCFFSVSNNDSVRSFISAPFTLRFARLFIARRLRCACVTHSTMSIYLRCQIIYNAPTALRAPRYSARLSLYILGPSIYPATGYAVDTVVGEGKVARHLYCIVLSVERPISSSIHDASVTRTTSV
jgi:hypothetical protein